MSIPDQPAIPSDTVAVILAAGGGSRFHASMVAQDLATTHKLLAPLRGRTVFDCALANVIDAGFASILVVTGAVDLPTSAMMSFEGRIEVLHNAVWSEGQATSLARAIGKVRTLTDVQRVVVGLGDQPFIPAQAWRAVALYEAVAGQPIVVATYGGKRRNPVRLDRSVWDLVPREGDEGARPLLRSHPHLVTEVACEGEPADIDTAEDLLRWS